MRCCHRSFPNFPVNNDLPSQIRCVYVLLCFVSSRTNNENNLSWYQRKEFETWEPCSRCAKWKSFQINISFVQLSLHMHLDKARTTPTHPHTHTHVLFFMEVKRIKNTTCACVAARNTLSSCIVPVIQMSQVPSCSFCASRVKSYQIWRKWNGNAARPKEEKPISRWNPFTR